MNFQEYYHTGIGLHILMVKEYVCTKAARKALNKWAMEIICKTLDDELLILKPTMSLPQQDLSEEVLLSISWKEMIPELKSKVPVLWKLFHYTMYMPRQEQRNQSKDPDAVLSNVILKLGPLTFHVD
jgi:hypothetical protein